MKARVGDIVPRNGLRFRGPYNAPTCEESKPDCKAKVTPRNTELFAKQMNPSEGPSQTREEPWT